MKIETNNSNWNFKLETIKLEIKNFMWNSKLETASAQKFESN